MNELPSRAIPKLRFPQFQTAPAWEMITFQEICDIRDGTHDSPKPKTKGVPLVTSKNILNGRLNFEDITYISIDDAIKINKRSRVHNGDILMSMIGTLGNVATVDSKNDFCIKNVALIKPKRVYQKFLYYWMVGDSFQKTLLATLSGGIQKFISLKNLRNLNIKIPKPEEQKAIADCLSSLDASITAQKQKQQALQAHKKGLMQQLFPTTGKNIPKLRFPQFQNAPAWASKPLSDVLDYERPEKFIVSSTKYQDKGTPVLTANKSFILGYTNETDGIYRTLPVIIFDDFTTDKKYVDFPFKVKSSAIKILKSKGDDIRLLFELMNRIRFNAENHKRYYISEYQNVSIFLPKPEEQKAIADCLANLDTLMTAQAQKIAVLQDHKKGLMQQLFPTTEEMA